MMKTRTFAHEFFEEHRRALDQTIAHEMDHLKTSGEWQQMVDAAGKDLDQWQSDSGRKQNYSPEGLAFARMSRQAANIYETTNQVSLFGLDAKHQALLQFSILSDGLGDKLLAQGQKGNRLGLLELSARLMPILTFPGSSAYFEIGIVPYGKHSRDVLGESQQKGFVCQEAATKSAQNLQSRFGVHYALAETSAAPRRDVPKSGRRPVIFICGMRGPELSIITDYLIDTPLRSEFNSVAREKMYNALEDMYNS